MPADAIVYARLQFALTAVAHWLFVALTLGLVTYVVIIQTMWTVTGNPRYERMTRFFGQLYLINYALGIATGIVMEFQFGLNWSGLTKVTGSVFGAPLAIETLVAFFLESTFLGIWIFGWNRLGKRLHLAMIWLTAITAWMSVFWVLMANSFLQHPVGHASAANGRLVLADFAEFVGNPNFWHAIPHAAAAAITTGTFFVAGVSAWHLRRLPEGHEDRAAFLLLLRMAVYIAPFFVFVTAFMGGQLLDVINVEQPIKGALADNDLALAARLQEEMVAKHGPGEYIPVHEFIYITRTVMIWSAITLQAVSVITALMTIKISLLLTRFAWLLRVFPWLIPVPFLAATAGWLFREVGRQPWAVYEILKTEDAISPGLTSGVLLTSLIVFTLVVGALAVTDWRLLAKFARRGPDAAQLGSQGQETDTDEEEELAITGGRL
ncbi:cytochrome ubiquinol oxidase subunit I [Nonomuraea turcica]|uniref:cytochrome ubiquinol oxidase subunit I n=1 Tax=Nonomuraea sp. G32 TaxID=3067274 RepID=UPI00273C9CD8|nr:cytochrome ubiquinol oxidase subunit I [Nonomuraea sp. G32]MDP4503512.1 cytochrome ubiquinol oxidase subunit I [Nonomuraea sp. G32]